MCCDREQHACFARKKIRSDATCSASRLSLHLAPVQDELPAGQRDTKREGEDMSRLSLEFRNSLSRKSTDHYVGKGVVSF